jgi:outer membrane protein assembly factor BamB
MAQKAHLVPLLLLLIPVCAFGQKAEDEKTIVPFPTSLLTGVADPDGRQGYLRNPGGQVEAVDLKTGELLWSTKEICRPLIVVRQRLIAQVGRKVLLLDLTNKGKKVLESEDLPFPEWARVDGLLGSFTPKLGRMESFELTPWIKDGKLLLRWSACAGDISGVILPIAPKTENEQNYRHASGLVRVDLDSGRVDVLNPDAETETQPKSLREFGKWNRAANLQRVQLVSVVDGEVVMVSKKNEDGRQSIQLLKWDLETEKAVCSMELMQGKRLDYFTPPDGRHVFVFSYDPSAPPTANYQSYSVFTVKSGKCIGKGELPADCRSSVSVAGSRLFHVTAQPPKDQSWVNMIPQTLQAFDIETGKKLWERPVEGRANLLIPP